MLFIDYLDLYPARSETPHLSPQSTHASLIRHSGVVRPAYAHRAGGAFDTASRRLAHTMQLFMLYHQQTLIPTFLSISNSVSYCEGQFTLVQIS